MYSGQTDSSDIDVTMAPNRRSGSCYISTTVGLVLVFLAVLLAVAVGLIVFFAADGRDVECHCGSYEDGSPKQALDIQKCQDMAEKGNERICNKCSDAPKSTDTPFTSVAPTTASGKDIRLPTTLTPMHYDVELQPYMHDPNPKKFTFRGSVLVIVECKSATDSITLHINVLEVDQSTIAIIGLDPDETSVPSYRDVEFDMARQFIIIKFNRNMQVGKQYAVKMEFKSPLTDDLKGLYYSSYQRDNTTVYLATTQFSPTDARKAFPCMDEPALKATFNITLVRPKHLVSISNMPIVDSSRSWTEHGIEYVADVYERTPIMSSYVLAFIVCDFKYITDTTANGVQYRVWARPGAQESTRYSMDVGVKVLTYFEDYFEIKFPLPKQDMIAIPDLSPGAMENWGLITYRETAMLFDPKLSNERNKQRIVLINCHETAHMWFGDLVSINWWDDVWLKEGFASYMMYLGIDYVRPEWNIFDMFVTSEVQDVFNFDGLVSSHPVYVPLSNPDQINEIFDRISYGKGAVVVRMMRHFLGVETFRKGIVRYLKDRAYGAATHNDLWNALSDQAKSEGKNIDVKSIMATWILQMNYPLVTVTRDANDNNVIHVTQERYLIDRKAKDPGVYKSPFGYKWYIPLTLTSSESLHFNQTDKDVIWMNQNESSKTFKAGQSNLPDPADTNGWILANVGQYGFYRVNYDLNNWIALANQLKTKHTVIPVTNRAQIINDAWNIAKSGELKLDTALLMIEYLDKETDYIPWQAADRELSYVLKMISLTSANGPFNNFVRKMSKKAFDTLGLNNTGSSHTDTYTRVLVASLACRAGNEDCQRETSRQYKQWMDQPDANLIDSNLKFLVYCNAIASGGWDEWNFALQMYLKSTFPSEKATLLSAMTCSQKPWILNTFLNMILEEKSPIRKQDALNVISQVSSSSIGRPVAWNFFRANFDHFSSIYSNMLFQWSGAINSMATSFNTEYELQEIKSFMEKKADLLGTGKRAFEQATEKIRSNIIWMKTNVHIIKAWLENRSY